MDKFRTTLDINVMGAVMVSDGKTSTPLRPDSRGHALSSPPHSPRPSSPRSLAPSSPFLSLSMLSTLRLPAHTPRSFSAPLTRNYP